MKDQRKVAVVILNWNGSQLLEKYLPSVIRHSAGPGREIVVADNGSTDDSRAFLRTHFPEVRIIELTQNYGFAGGYNQALKEVEADYFVLLNSDVEVTEKWLEQPIQRMETDPSVAVVQPKILDFHKRDFFEYAGAAGGFIDQYGYPFCRGRILNITEKDEGQYNHPSPVFWASGACMFVKAALFKETGGFDPGFWAHMEEIDFCWRLKNRGYTIWYEPESVVYHLGGGTLHYKNPQKVYLNFRNNLLMLLKNLPRQDFLLYMPLRIILDGVAALKFLAGLNLHSFWSVLKAHAFLYRHFVSFYRKRKELIPLTTHSSHKEIYKSSIMFRFFIQRKRTFRELHFNQ
jgi:GT2 family glycosyltransferase